LDYSLDNLSLMALTLSVGFVVDDAIVMLENIVRHMEMGKPRLQAALDGSAEISFTIVSMTVSLAAVFIPILFMGGIVGRLMHESAATLAATVYLFTIVPTGFIPSVDTGALNGQVETIQGIGFDQSVKHHVEIMNILDKDPNVAAYTVNVGGMGGGRLDVELK